jgi:hypothetical protein
MVLMSSITESLLRSENREWSRGKWVRSLHLNSISSGVSRFCFYLPIPSYFFQLVDFFTQVVDSEAPEFLPLSDDSDGKQGYFLPMEDSG